MNAYLLYPGKDWNNTGHYFDENAIIQDLGLNTLFSASAREIEKKDGKVNLIRKTDLFLESTMKKVTMAPLEREEDILYRQEIVKDCYAEEKFICRLYELSRDILTEWDKLGRRVKAGTRNSPRTLIAEIHVLQLFVTSLSQLKSLLRSYEGKLHSRGFKSLHERLCVEFSDETEADLKRILEGVAFYANQNEHSEQETARVVNKPKVVMSCSIGDGLKLENFRLEEVSTEVRRYRDPNGNFFSRAQEYLSGRTKDTVFIQRETELSAASDQMEYQLVRHIIFCCEPFMNAFNGFFDQLHLQAAFYRGAVNLRHYMERFDIQYCFPKVTERDTLRFQELKEFVMGVEQRKCPVGNTCDIAGRMLLLVTGANQGGKSTFLRSIGIAQIMMQCGLPVTADSYESGIFPAFFTHFTRREDSEMNSGRLDEELGRMRQIVDNLGTSSMVLLNESFASTTEKEGSVIAYDIIKALTETGVKVLAVTHLLSFARRMYGEAGQNADSGVEFLSAERKEDGMRTFKMIQHAPELTSFGLDLYDKIIGAGKIL